MTSDERQTTILTSLSRIPNAAILCALGVFAARLVAEVWPWPLPLAGVTALTAMCVGLAAWMNRRLRFEPARWWPALLLAIYVFWPARGWGIAAAVVLLALITAAIAGNVKISRPQPQPKSLASCRSWRGWHRDARLLSDRLPAWGVFAVSLTVYALTLQKDVLPADSGEFQLAASQLGIAHPPGYPLYTMVGKLFTLFTPRNPALGLDAMSAVLAAATLALTFMAVQRFVAGLPGARQINQAAGNWGGLAAALALGTSTTFWAQATTANIRMPTLFFVAWCLYEISNLQPPIPNPQSPISNIHQNTIRLARFALALSLGLGHHPSLAFVGLFFVLYIVLVDSLLLRTPRRWPGPLAAFAAGQLVWLYLPIRDAMGAYGAPGNLTTLQGFLFHVLAQGFGGDMFAFAAPHYLAPRAALVPMLFSFQFNTALLAAAALGGLIAAWRNWRLAVLLWGAWTMHVFVTITYRAPQTVEYMMPAYAFLVIALGIAAGQLVALAQKATSDYLFALSAAVILLAGVLNGAAHAPGYIQLAGDRSTREYVWPILRDAPPGALILADWHWATPMEYLQVVEGARPDLEVEYVYPLGDVDYTTRWQQRIEQNIAQRPIVATRYSGAAGYAFQPLNQAFRVLAQPGDELPSGFTPARINFEGQVRVTGYHLDRAAFHAGQAFELALAWQSLAPIEHEYAFTVHVLDASGRHVAQRDRALPAGTITPGQTHVEQFVLPLAIELAPGDYQIAIGTYYPLPEGGWRNLEADDPGRTTLPMLTHISLDALTKAPFTLHPLDIPFENGARLVGVDYDRSDPNVLRVYLHWKVESSTWKGNNKDAIIYVQSGSAIDKQAMPTIPAGAYQTTAHDLAAADTPSLVLQTSGAPVKLAGAWGVAQTQLALPPPTPGCRYVLLGDQFALTNVTSGPESLEPGGQLQLELTFVALRSLVSDNSTSVRLLHREGAWWLAQDTKPGLDTIRTLKWIAGSRVVDPHSFTLPPDAAPGWAEAHLKVYDEFRQAILPPLDTRMGDSILMGVWQVVP